MASDRAEHALVIFLGRYQLSCNALPHPAQGWRADWRIQQVGASKAGDLARGELSPLFADHRSAMAAARAAGMVILEAMHADAQRQLEYA